MAQQSSMSRTARAIHMYPANSTLRFEDGDVSRPWSALHALVGEQTDLKTGLNGHSSFVKDHIAQNAL